MVRLAALLHDIGHGPFSHSLEKVTSAGRPIHPTRRSLFEEGSIPQHWAGTQINLENWLNSPASHEDLSIAIISKLAEESDGQIGGIEAQDVCALICDWIPFSPACEEMDRVGPSGKWRLRKALRRIISGELDADRMDYLLRDSHYTGVPYGEYDREMLLGNIVFRPEPKKSSNDLCLALQRKALHALEDFLISRFHMFMQLYSHKTVVGFDVVLENAVAELPQFSIAPDLEDYLRWSDDWLLRKILENRSSQWGHFISNRAPLKHLFTVRQEQQKEFLKFIKPFELSRGTTAWFPALKNKERKCNDPSIPKLWWRPLVSYLTKEARGTFPLYLEDKRDLIPVEKVSLLLNSDYVRQFEMIHVYCLRGQERETTNWLLQKGISSSILSSPKSLVP